MGELKDRAKFYANGQIDIKSWPENALAEQLWNINKQAYLSGATEQKKIDIEKACEFFRPYLYNLVDRYSDANLLIEAFRKKMEEDI